MSLPSLKRRSFPVPVLDIFPDEDVPRVQVAVHKIVQKHHLQESIQAHARNQPLLRHRVVRVFKDLRDGRPVHVVLHQHELVDQRPQRLGKTDVSVVLEIGTETVQ